ncbi:HAMP domain-containing sensor histidine kinase [Kribbella sp. NPDC005582]|uniref:HAMP domain-containing sensor histidine kinase n=1 Tax=Kribbella sp. NPDC005582 TaxID=3156893 RepID=UPI0033A7A87C
MGLTGLRARIVSLAVLTATLVVAVLVVISHVLLTRATEADTRTLAQTRADAVAATVEVRDGKVRPAEGAGDAFDTIAWVYLNNHRIDGELHSAVAETVDQLGSSTQARFLATGHYLLYAEPLPTPGLRIVVVVVVDLTPYESSEQRGLIMSLALGAFVIVLTAVIAYIGVSRALRVVRRMSALADEWGSHDATRRFALGPPRDELGELAQTFDRLLDRVAATIADERRLTDEIAHELRTPLTVLRGEAQLAELSALQVDPQLVLTETDRLSTAVSTILDAARSRTDRETSCVLVPVLHRLSDHRIDAPPDVEVGVAAEVVTAVLAPLIDNATRHARTTVAVRVVVDGNYVVIHVLDDGPGFRPDDLDVVFAPGHSGTNGHGLGLAVVRRIATATGLDVRAIADGRGHVEVRLPIACPP